MTGIKTAAVLRNQSIPPEQLEAIEAEMLNRLIQVQVLLQQATDADRAEGNKVADLQIKTLLERAGSQEALDHQFLGSGHVHQPASLASGVGGHRTSRARSRVENHRDGCRGQTIL